MINRLKQTQLGYAFRLGGRYVPRQLLFIVLAAMLGAIGSSWCWAF